ncbi:hypothetical protein F2Q69_00013551 [Brassica cretica]|uniref:Uncharacterized protein n=1 Tax=Brassica cretica TaxID=69181 RepID=A0A8S9QK02_BRACR|nr:hypothetical protein F2Q69_00013551 [Brassica cretica]
MGATSPERHREVAVTPLQSDLARATPRCRSRFHCSEARERPYQSDAEKSLAFSSLGGTRATLSERRGEVTRVFIAQRHESDPERRLAATPPGRSRSLERPFGATTGGRCAPFVCSTSCLLKGLLVISLCTFLLSKLKFKYLLESIVGARISSECEGLLQLGATSSERHSQVARVFAVFGHEIDLAATFRSETIRLLQLGATWLERHSEIARIYGVGYARIALGATS